MGWSHGNEEIFTREQLVEWFDAAQISASASKFDPDKLLYLNQEHIKRADAKRLGELLTPFVEAEGQNPKSGADIGLVADLLRDRAHTLPEMAKAARYFYEAPVANPTLLAQHLTDSAKPAIAELQTLLASVNWTKADINATIKTLTQKHNLKMPQLMMPLRVLVTGQTQTPAIDAVMAVLGRDEVMKRLATT